MASFEERYVTDDEFDQALSIAAELQRARGLWWRLSVPTATLAPRLDERLTLDELENHELSREQFEKALNEISLALRKVLNDKVSALTVGFRVEVDEDGTRRRRYQQLTDEQKATIQRRREAVHSTLVTKDLAERWLLFHTAKGDVVDSIKWDINIKKHDLDVGPISDIPFATLELLMFPAATYSTPAGLFAAPRSVSFDCHAGDIEVLINELTVIRDNLKKLGSSHDDSRT